MSIEIEKLRALATKWRAFRREGTSRVAFVIGAENAYRECADQLEALIAEQPAAQDPNHPEIPDSSASFAEPAAVPDGAALIAAERRRQIEKEGFYAAHDARYANDTCQLVSYAIFATTSDRGRDLRRTGVKSSPNWPWPDEWWKPGSDNSEASRIRELEKAGALIAATIDMLLAAREGQ